MEDKDGLTWRKSSYSGANGGQCVEVADHDNVIMVRDTTSRDRLTLSVSADAWRELVAKVKAS